MRKPIMLLCAAMLFACAELSAAELDYSERKTELSAQDIEEKFPSVIVPEDDVKAFDLLQKAANEGNANAQWQLGCRYASGRHVLKNNEKAFEWCQKAALQGYVYAECQLGGMYANGKCIPKDEKKAFQWFQKAAAKGYVMALDSLGDMYANGRGVPKNEAKAFECYQKVSESYQKAALEGYPAAQAYLGEMYANGKGVQRDIIQAYAWVTLAIAGGYSNASKTENVLEKSMTAKQKAEAKKLSAELLKIIHTK